MNVLEWRGPDFLVFYGILLLVTLAFAIVLRWLLRSPSDVPKFARNIDAYDAAYLVGGPRMAVNAAILALVHSGRIKVRLGSSLEAPDQAIFPFARHKPLNQVVFREIVSAGATVGRLHRSA